VFYFGELFGVFRIQGLTLGPSCLQMIFVNVYTIRANRNDAVYT